jgi:hypothetical protein
VCLSLKGKGSDLTGRAIDELINAAEEIQPKARLVFSLFLADQNPELIVNGSSWLNNLQLESMDAAQISQLLIAIADTLDKSKQGASSLEKKSEKHSLLNAS